MKDKKKKLEKPGWQVNEHLPDELSVYISYLAGDMTDNTNQTTKPTNEVEQYLEAYYKAKKKYLRPNL